MMYDNRTLTLQRANTLFSTTNMVTKESVGKFDILVPDIELCAGFARVRMKKLMGQAIMKELGRIFFSMITTTHLHNISMHQ